MRSKYNCACIFCAWYFYAWILLIVPYIVDTTLRCCVLHALFIPTYVHFITLFHNSTQFPPFSVVVMDNGQSFLFKPVHANSQRFLCSLVNTCVIIEHKFVHGKDIRNLNTPSKIFKIKGDGNCFFRALSYIITGRQTYHVVLRKKIIDHMRIIENLLQPHLSSSLSDYLNNSQVANESVWATDVEIFSACSLLETDIYVYTKVGQGCKWQKFSKSMLNESPPINDRAIYLNHTGGVHYDVVLEVDFDLLPSNELYNTNKKRARDNLTNECNQPTIKRQKVDDAYPIEQEVVQKLETCNLFKNQLENVSKFHKSMEYVIRQCGICYEAWPVKANKKKCPYVCSRCSLDKINPKKFSAQNSMIPSVVPTELQGLTQIEEMLIARALPIMKVYIKPGGQRGYYGHCINMPQKITELAHTLPRYPKDIPLILVTMKGKNNTFKNVLVRKAKVEQALFWLLKHNPHYRNVKIDTFALDNLPQQGIPSDLKTIDTQDNFTIDDHEISEDDGNNSDDDTVYNKNIETSSFLPESKNKSLEVDAILRNLGACKIN